MLKQAFRQSKEFQEEVVLLFNAFSNRLDDFVNTSNKKDVINHYQTRNATSPQLLGTRRNRVVSHFEKRKKMEDGNRDMSKVCFLYQGIIKCN